MVSQKLPWFPCYPSKLLGAFAAMQPHEGYVYWIVCLRIYEVDGPCADSPDALARRTGLPRGKVVDALGRLFATGKLVQTDAGIMNPFAAAVIEDRKAHKNVLKKAGQAGGIARHQKHQQKQRNDPSPAKAGPKRGSSKYTETDTLTETEERKEQTGFALSGGDSAAKDDWPSDYAEQFWRQYPPGRKTEKKAVVAKLANVRKSGKVTWARLIAGVLRYAASGVEEQFTKAPLVWLNRGCWDDEYGRGVHRQSRKSGGNGFLDIAPDFAGGGYGDQQSGDGFGPVIEGEFSRS